MSIHEATVRAAEREPARIQATIVADEHRLDFLPRHFGEKHMLRAEATVYGLMQRLTHNGYQGGHWHFIELSNGGFYLRVNGEKRYTIAPEGNFFKGEMSADAASITACLFAINQLIWQGLHLQDAYDRLKDFACEHDEFESILAAID